MTVREIKERLNKFPDNMDVFISARKSEFAYGLANSVYMKKINFVDEPKGEVAAREMVVIIDEE